jgi:hypothetical protein
MRTPAANLLACVLAALPVVLHASLTSAAEIPPVMRLDYLRDAAAASCPDEQEFRDAMTAHVHRPLFDPAASDRLVVRLQGRSGSYRGVAELRDASGVPAWTIPLGPIPRDCSSIVDSLALAIAIKVDPRGSKAPPSTPASAPNGHRWFGLDGEILPMPAPTATESAPSPDAVAPPTTQPEPEIRGRLGASGGVAIAAVPGWAPSVTVDAGLHWRDRPLSVAIEGNFVPPASADVMSGPHLVQVTAYRLTGAGVACGHFLRYLFACGVAAAGALHGTGTAMSLVGQPVTAFYMGAGGRGGVEFPLHAHVAVRASGEALVTIARPVVQAAGAQVYEASLVSGTVGAGLVFNF